MSDSENTQQQTSFNVLLIGDSCVDEYKIGTVERISPEAPVPIIKIVDSYTIPGMASNVYQNLCALGVDTEFITNLETITKTRFIDKKSGQHLLRVDNDRKLTPWSGRYPLPLKEYDAIVISDYDKGFITYKHIEDIIKNFNGPVFIDTKKRDLERFQGAWVKINALEYSRLTSECSGLIVTMGEEGAKVIHHDIHCPADRVEVMDVCGCGDTFLSAMAYQYLMTNKIEDAIVFANKAAAVTVQHRGNYAPTLKEIK